MPHNLQGQNLDVTPNLKRWYEHMRNRPAVQRGFAVMAEEVAKMREAAAARQRPHDQESWNNLFGNKQFEKRYGEVPELQSLRSPIAAQSRSYAARVPSSSLSSAYTAGTWRWWRRAVRTTAPASASYSSGLPA